MSSFRDLCKTGLLAGVLSGVVFAASAQNVRSPACVGPPSLESQLRAHPGDLAAQRIELRTLVLTGNNAAADQLVTLREGAGQVKGRSFR
ncbi:MAG: hypothetical protein ACP5E2_09195 [Terracidiphilus sp.]